jgi:hypothetical protein
MTVYLIGYNLAESERTILTKIGTFVAEKYKIVDLMSYDLRTTNQDVLLVFGHRANRLTASLSCLTKIEFAEPCYLANTPDNEERRVETLRRLEELKKKLSLDVTETKTPLVKYNEQDLPNLTTQDILLQLRVAMHKTDQQEWLGWTSNGKTIRLTIEPAESTADINMTFAELFALKTTMDILQVKEVEVITNKS